MLIVHGFIGPTPTPCANHRPETSQISPCPSPWFLPWCGDQIELAVDLAAERALEEEEAEWEMWISEFKKTLPPATKK